MTKTKKHVLTYATWNARSLWKRYLTLMLLVSIGIGLCVSTMTLSQHAQKVADNKGEQAVALRSLSLQSYPDRQELKHLTTANLNTIAALPQVEKVEPLLQAAVGFKSQELEVPGALIYAHSWRASNSPPIVASSREQLFPLKAGEIVLPKFANGIDLTRSLGKQITIDYQQTTGPSSGTGAQDQITVVGLSDPSWQVDGPDAAYADDAILQKWVAARMDVSQEELLNIVGFDSATVIARNANDVDALLSDLQAQKFAAVSLKQQLAEIPSTLKLLGIIGKALLVVLVLLVVLGAATNASALVRQRTREIGLLQSVGWKPTQILRLFLAETVLVISVSIISGLILAIGVATALARLLSQTDDLKSYLSSGVALPDLTTSAITIALIVAGILLGSMPSLRRGTKMDPATALRDW